LDEFNANNYEIHAEIDRLEANISSLRKADDFFIQRDNFIRDYEFDEIIYSYAKEHGYHGKDQDFYKSRAQFILYNEGSLSELGKSIEDFYAKLKI